MSYTVWWDHKVNLDPKVNYAEAADLANVLISDIPTHALAERIAVAFRDELANLGHPIFVAVSN